MDSKTKAHHDTVMCFFRFVTLLPLPSTAPTEEQRIIMFDTYKFDVSTDPYCKLARKEKSLAGKIKYLSDLKKVLDSWICILESEKAIGEFNILSGIKAHVQEFKIGRWSSCVRRSISILEEGPDAVKMKMASLSRTSGEKQFDKETLAVLVSVFPAKVWTPGYLEGNTWNSGYLDI
jgi:hypothetical protein